MNRVAEILDRRRRLIEESRAILDKAKEEKRALTSEESANYDRMFNDAQKLGEDAKRAEQQEAIERSLEQPVPLLVPGVPIGAPTTETRTKDQKQLELENRGVAGFLRGGYYNMRDDEKRALEASTDSAGGYLFAPEQFLARLIVALGNAVYIRSKATVIPLTESDTLGVPNLETDVSDPAWTSEVAAIGEDSSLALGKRALKPEQLAKLVKVSQKLLRIASIDPEALVIQRLVYKFQAALENGYLNGNGTAPNPLGLFTASANGIPTSRDVVTGTATDITVDGFLDVLYSVKAQYRRLPSFGCITSREVIKRLSKKRDESGGAGTGQYLWEPSLKQGEPDRFKAVPLYESEYAPATFTTGLYVGVMGALEYYWIVDLLKLQLQRLNELFALNSQVGFIGKLESNGQPVLAEAFARMKLA